MTLYIFLGLIFIHLIGKGGNYTVKVVVFVNTSKANVQGIIGYIQSKHGLIRHL